MPMKNNKFNELAKERIDELIKLMSNNFELNISKAILLSRKEKYDLALTYFQKKQNL